MTIAPKGAPATPIAAAVGRRPKETIWLQVRLVASPPDRAVVGVEHYDGIELQRSEVVYDGTAIMAIRVFNDTVDVLKGEGFRGLNKIEAAGGFDAYEVALRAYAAQGRSEEIH